MTIDKDSKHWAQQSERGSFFWMKITAVLTRVMGRTLLTPILYGIVFIFSQRVESRVTVFASTKIT